MDADAAPPVRSPSALIMAAQLLLPSPVLSPSSKTRISACSSLCYLPSISTLTAQRCWSYSVRLKKRRVDLTTKCLETSPDVGESLPSPPLTILVKRFYELLNKKDSKKLYELFDTNCVFEDLAYPIPFKGKQVQLFLEELSKAMGRNLRFCIDDVYEDSKLNAGARWHLEWNERAIPFTKGCSFFYCPENAQRLLIKNACVFVESPVKPGAVVLELLRVVTTFFDKFPKLAVWFLEKPSALFQFMMKAYKLFVEPLTLPLLVYYTHVWTYLARLLGFVLNLVQSALKLLM